MKRTAKAVRQETLNKRLEQAEVIIYTSTYCHFCGLAKSLLDVQGIRFCEIDLDLEPPELAEKLKRKTGLMSVPQIFVGGQFIGNYEDLVRLDKDNGLKRLLRAKYAAA